MIARVRVGRWFDETAQDLRIGLRALRARPGFTLVTLLTIAIGLGANIAIFSVVNTVYLRPLPFDAEDRLMRVQEFSVAPDGTRRRVSAMGATFELVREHVRSFDAVVAQTGESFTLDGTEGAERVGGALVSAGWGRLLGLSPALGRHFSPEEEQAADAGRAVLISHGLWQRQFAGRADVLGAPLRLSGREFTVVGVMPPGFRYPYDADLWLPALFARDRGLYVLGRLAPGATLAHANAELAAIGERIGEIFPNRAGMSVDAHLARTNLQQGEDRLAIALMGAVGFLLLIACANVAMLMTTRFAARQRDVAVRAALGCGRARQLRQFISESVLLFALGGALGLLLTLWLQGWLRTLVPRVMATQLAMGDVAIDLRVAVFGFVLAVACGVASGAIAAARASAADLHGLLKQGGRSASGSGGRTLGALVVSEIALAVMLLTGAGVMVSAFQRAQRQDLGFAPEGLLTFRLDLANGRYQDGATRLDLLDRLADRLRALPGVAGAGTISVNPLCCGDWGARVVIEGQPPATADATPVIFHRLVTPGLLEAMGVRLLEGRMVSPQDTALSQPVVVVDEHLARRYFPGRSAIGGRIKRAPYDSPRPWLTIVGVVADVDEEGEYHEGWYVPYAQDAAGPSAQFAHVMVRTGGDPLALVASARQALADIDRGIAGYDFTTMDRIRVEQLQQERLGAILIMLFAGFGLLLATLGVYGLTAFAISQRLREIGVRLALGATSARVMSHVLGRGLRLAAGGVVLGIAGAFVAVRALASLMPDVGAANQVVVWSAAVILAGVALAASALPAWRALRLDPVEVLRGE